MGSFAHSRHNFEKALSPDKELAARMLEAVRRLYLVEEEARQANLFYSDRYKLRQEKSVLILSEIRD